MRYGEQVDLINIIKLKEIIIEYMRCNNQNIEIQDNVIKDIVMLFTILGNDFLPKLEIINTNKHIPKIFSAYLQLNNKVDCVDHYNENHKIGFSISNFLNTLEYENRLLKEQISLYINYVSFFHISEKRQLNRLFMRMQEFYKEIDENININRTFSIADISEQDRLHRFYIIGEYVEIENILEDFEFITTNITIMPPDPSGGNPPTGGAAAIPLPETNKEEPEPEQENICMEMREETKVNE
jgi:hypothetical protein